jgi:hypothetical protein
MYRRRELDVTQLVEVATRISTPLMLAGFLVAAFFLISTLAQRLPADVIKPLIERPFNFALVSLFLGFAGFVLAATRQSDQIGFASREGARIEERGRQKAQGTPAPKNSLPKASPSSLKRRSSGTGVVIAIEQSLVRRCVAQRALMAFFRDDQERMSPVRNTLNTDRDEDWIGLQFTNYDGPRISLGVPDVVDKSPVRGEVGWENKIVDGGAL